MAGQRVADTAERERFNCVPNCVTTAAPTGVHPRTCADDNHRSAGMQAMVGHAPDLPALNIATGKVIGKLSGQHRAVDFRDFWTRSTARPTPAWTPT